MNRFDRVTSLLLLLQTRTVVTAQFLADHFDVTERTIYRDIRTLENAGVPIGSEAGVGYFLEKGYHLPPVSYTLDEAAALLLGEKLLLGSLDAGSYADYQLALNKVRAVLDSADKDHLNSLAGDIEVLPTGLGLNAVRGIGEVGAGGSEDRGDTKPGALRPNNASADRWMKEARHVLVRRQVVDITYAAGSQGTPSDRHIEPIGLFYYSLHWHLIAWCRLRQGYRDFRLDRIERFEPQSEQFPKHSRDSLQDYLAVQTGGESLLEVELLFAPEVVRFVGENRYQFGFLSEEAVEGGVKMTFLTSVPHYMARWLTQYTSGVQILKGDGLIDAMKALSQELQSHWVGDSPS